MKLYMLSFHSKIFVFLLDICFQFTFLTISLPCYFCFMQLVIVSLPFVLPLLLSMVSFDSFLCLFVTPLHFFSSQILPSLSAFCSSDFFPNVSLSFPIWFLSPSTNVYFLAPILLSTFPFQVLFRLISVFIFVILSLLFSTQIGLKYCRKSCSWEISSRLL